MKYRYGKYVEDLLDGVDMETLLERLSDLLLSSGFNNPWDPLDGGDQSMQALHDAVLDALLNGGAMSEDMVQNLVKDLGDPSARDRIEALVQKVIEQLTDQGFVSTTGTPPSQQAAGTAGPDQSTTRFEVTDKALDFLGYRALRDLLGSMGRSSVGRHDTTQLATGVDAGGPPRPYEFGDTMNLDASATILNSVQRGNGLDVDYEDLMVTQGDYQSSCATVLLLDCSHSMVLYGEDRFTCQACRARAHQPDQAPISRR